MKVLSHSSGRSTVLISGDDLRPVGGVNLILAMRKIKERYNFVWAPELKGDPEQALAGPFRFHSGQFSLQEGLQTIQSLEFYNDGVIATAASTQIADMILADFFGWAEIELKMRPVPKTARRIFTSTLVVEFGKSIDVLMSSIDAVNQLAQQFGAHPRPRRWVLGGFQLAPSDDDDLPFKYPAQFSFNLERRSDAPLSANRYFSAAPLCTEDHERFLEGIEKIVSEDSSQRTQR
jgi:hypothetical protein